MTVQGGAGTTQRWAAKGLDREVILDAAGQLIDARGLQTLTMRKLAQHLGVEAMSLYRYVAGREDLLEGVVSRLTGRVLSTLDPNIADTWQGYLQVVANAIRGIAVDHPAAFPLVATRHPAAPWLRPPLRDIDLVENFLTTMSGFGFTDEQVVDIYRSFSSFLLGQLLLESAVRGAETSPIEEPLDEGGASMPNADGNTDVTSRPTITRMQPLLSEDHSAAEFEITLEALIDRLELIYVQ